MADQEKPEKKTAVELLKKHGIREATVEEYAKGEGVTTSYFHLGHLVRTKRRRWLGRWRVP